MLLVHDIPASDVNNLAFYIIFIKIEEFKMNTGTHKGTALITGASSGIGAVYADRLARRGYDLILVARDQARLGTLAARLTAETGREVETIAADLLQKADVLKLEQRLRSDSGITLLLNNAGVGATAKLVDADLEKMEQMIQLNVIALTRLAGAAAISFSQRGKGIVINIASIVALAPELLNGVYSGSKAFVVNFTQSMHHELADKGIQVQAVLPGATSTDFWDKAGLAVQHLPSEIVMTAEEMVDAALAGLDQRELITIPSLPNAADWDAYDAARKHLGPNLSLKHAAGRYKV